MFLQWEPGGLCVCAARSTEGASAAGLAAIEGGDGGAFRFILRAEDLHVTQDTSTGMRKPHAAAYAACVASSLAFVAAKEHQRAPHGGPPVLRDTTSQLPTLHKGRESPAGDCRSLEVPAATPSKAAAQAFLSAIGVEPRPTTAEPMQTVAPRPPPGVVPTTHAITQSAAAEERREQRKRQRVEGKASSRSPSPAGAASDRKSDDEVVILEGTAPPPPARHSRKSGPPAGSYAVDTSSLQPSSQPQQLHQQQNAELPDLAKGRPIDNSAENQARERLRQLLQCECSSPLNHTLPRTTGCV